jgi:hypothetical protein
MMRSIAITTLSACALFTPLGGVACGDVTSDLITGSPTPAGGSAGASAGGTSSGSGGTPECTAHDDCTDSELNRCDVTRGRCVECIDEGQCDIEEDCNAVIGECGRRCASSAECIEPDDPVCDTLNGFCVECLADDDCPSGGQCANWQCSD